MKVSIIIPAFQAARFLEETLHSVFAQTGTDVELIVIDGGSTDGTQDILRKHESKIAYWISEPDRGQADAINKGLRRVTGDVVSIFTADDLFADGIFAAVAEAWRKNPRTILAGPVANFYTRGRETLLRPHDITLANVVQYWQRRSLWHLPGMFWPREVIEATGELDISLHYAFDYEYLIRALRNFEVAYVDRVAAGFRLHGDSKSVSQAERMMNETAAVSQRYWSLVPDVDREGFARAEHTACLRRGASHLLRGKWDGFAFLRRALRERPFASIAQLVTLGPTILLERLRRLRPARHL